MGAFGSGVCGLHKHRAVVAGTYVEPCSNHCGNLARWSCSLLSNSLITCGAQCAGNELPLRQPVCEEAFNGTYVQHLTYEGPLQSTNQTTHNNKNRPPQKSQTKKNNNQKFFCSSCRARSRLWRSSKRLWSVNYSQVVREQVKMQKTGCPQWRKQTKQTPKPNKQPNKPPRKEEDIQWTKWNKTYALRTNWTLGALSSSSRRHSKIPQVEVVPRCPL